MATQMTDPRNAVAKDLAASMYRVLLALDESDVSIPGCDEQDQARLSAFGLMAPAPSSRCFYLDDLEGQLYRVVIKPVKAGDDGE